MGLDMYLSKEYYVKNWDWKKPEDTWHISAMRGNDPRRVGRPEPLSFSLPTEDISYITTEVAYWRKANAIHKWFVDNIQEGVDECQKSFVSGDSLGILLGVVKEVLDDHDKAEELLPVQEGFFFGGYDYDDWYFECLKYTKETFEKILEQDKKEKEKNVRGDFFYQASW